MAEPEFSVSLRLPVDSIESKKSTGMFKKIYVTFMNITINFLRTYIKKFCVDVFNINFFVGSSENFLWKFFVTYMFCVHVMEKICPGTDFFGHTFLARSQKFGVDPEIWCLGPKCQSDMSDPEIWGIWPNSWNLTNLARKREFWQISLKTWNSWVNPRNLPFLGKTWFLGENAFFGVLANFPEIYPVGRFLKNITGMVRRY